MLAVRAGTLRHSSPPPTGPADALLLTCTQWCCRLLSFYASQRPCRWVLLCRVKAPNPGPTHANNSDGMSIDAQAKPQILEHIQKSLTVTIYDTK